MIREDFSIILKNNFKIDPAKLPELSAKVKQYYFGDKEVGLDTANQLTDVSECFNLETRTYLSTCTA